MPVYGAFASSTLAMLSQAHALATVGNNIANINTGGFYDPVDRERNGFRLRSGRFVLVSAPPDAGNPRPGRCSTAPSVACLRTNRARRVEPRWLSGPLVPTASILAVVSSPNRGT